MTDDFAQLERIAVDLVAAFDVDAPPVPIESMLQHPRDGMWEQVDINQLSGTFMSIRDRYSPRMSLARLLARHVTNSAWGSERGLLGILHKDETNIHAFARMLVMPQNMVNTLSAAARNPTTMSLQFEVPEDDARQRLLDMD